MSCKDTLYFIFMSTSCRKNSKHFLPLLNGSKKLNFELCFETQSHVWYFLVLITIKCLFFIELSLEKYSRTVDLLQFQKPPLVGSQCRMVPQTLNCIC